MNASSTDEIARKVAHVVARAQAASDARKRWEQSTSKRVLDELNDLIRTLHHQLSTDTPLLEARIGQEEGMHTVSVGFIPEPTGMVRRYRDRDGGSVTEVEYQLGAELRLVPRTDGLVAAIFFPPLLGWSNERSDTQTGELLSAHSTKVLGDSATLRGLLDRLVTLAAERHWAHEDA